MRPRRVRFTIRGLMIAVLLVAVLLSMPVGLLLFLIFYSAILAIMFHCACRLAIMNYSCADGWRTTMSQPGTSGLEIELYVFSSAGP